MAVIFSSDLKWHTTVWIYYSLPLFVENSEPDMSICQQRDTITLISSHSTTNKRKPHWGLKAPCCPPLPVRKTAHLSETDSRQTHAKSLQRFIFWLQASLSSCHCVLTGYLQWGHRLSTTEIIAKCPTLIWGLWKDPASWVNSMKGHNAERPAWVCSIIFQIYGCATSSTLILALGLPTNMVLKHVFIITFIQHTS